MLSCSFLSTFINTYPPWPSTLLCSLNHFTKDTELQMYRIIFMFFFQFINLCHCKNLCRTNIRQLVKIQFGSLFFQLASVPIIKVQTKSIFSYVTKYFAQQEFSSFFSYFQMGLLRKTVFHNNPKLGYKYIDDFLNLHVRNCTYIF